MSANDPAPFQLPDESIRAVDDAIAGRHLIRGPLAIPEGELVAFGIALGYADPEASESCQREPVAAFTDCRGF